MSEMIERVARAIRKAYHEHHKMPMRDWDRIDDEPKDEWLAMSRAAIGAMREPTEAMTKKASSFEVDFNSGGYVDLGSLYSDGAVAVWQSMIDEGLV